ncbi:hypothetical protein CQ020_11475 [Arthrobacter sp. MYb23]|uniref:hypothetical protein n=1 Tax=unclassified Arthrobacter TaxID=235627 RepID=UPI000CFE2CBB|nr:MULTISPECIES: hypothetical protein [unclassified Arthrobacter]PRB41401.1 hypothetical protein CQ038_13285 [Arthrobacter sp. MYb51]PRB95685.1 hypothetical protein CQ020_11475 [Arthrobacter sp. MYb23]
MRTSQPRAPFHALRSGVISLIVVLLAAGAHIVGGGELPTAPVLLALVALTALAATLATRFKLNLVTMAGILGAGQLALHEAFTALGPISANVQETKHHLGAEPLSAGLDIAATHTHELGTAFGTIMFVGHVVATIASAVVLAKGEDALWQLAAWLRPLLSLPSLVFRPDAGASPVAVGTPDVFIPRPWRNLRQDSRRGPPAGVVLP